MCICTSALSFVNSFFQAIFIGNVLQPFYLDVGNADMMGHDVGADEHFVSPTGSIFNVGIITSFFL